MKNRKDLARHNFSATFDLSLEVHIHVGAKDTMQYYNIIMIIQYSDNERPWKLIPFVTLIPIFS